MTAVCRTSVFCLPLRKVLSLTHPTLPALFPKPVRVFPSQSQHHALFPECGRLLSKPAVRKAHRIVLTFSLPYFLLSALIFPSCFSPRAHLSLSHRHKYAGGGGSAFRTENYKHLQY